MVTDGTGGVLPGAEIIVSNIEIGSEWSVTSDSEGRYAFPSLHPGTYFLIATAAGFADVILEGLELRVNSSATVPIVFSALATVTESVSISADAAQLNTTDASIGKAFGTKPIRQLPLNARNPAGLLSLQAGVTFLTADPLDAQKSGDIRNGTVNGAMSDQSNVTLDGVDVNDQQGRMAFTSVLRNTLDSIQEFRVVTTMANADLGRSSGAQVSLVTKSGTNDLHGSLYEFHRNTQTAANDFFFNAADVPRAKLIRNVFGTSVGGPIKRNRAFFFANYEGRRDASEESVVRTVPTAGFRSGHVSYKDVDGVTRTLDPNFIKASVDPRNLGVSSQVLEYLRSFPEPNDRTVGDGLNTAGYRFGASTPLVWNTYIAKVDFNSGKDGTHRTFWRGNFQNDSIAGTPQFPRQPPNMETLDTSSGSAGGVTSLFSTSVVSNLRFGFTNQMRENSGVQDADQVRIGDSLFDNLVGTTTPLSTSVWTHTIAQDISAVMGAHTLKFGGVWRSISNYRSNSANSFHFAKQAAWALTDAPQLDANLAHAPATRQIFQETAITALGIVNYYEAKYNYDITGSPQPAGAPTSRSFSNSESELYFQDSWRISPSVTVNAGLRWSLMPPIRESDGQQVSLAPGLDQYIATRIGLAEQGRPTAEAGSLGFVAADDPAGGPLWATHKKNFSPRVAVAWSPQFSDGLLGRLFGGPGRTSIRVGGGIFYSAFGYGMLDMLDRNAFGLSSVRINTNDSEGRPFTTLTSPRFGGPQQFSSEGLLPPLAGGPGTPNPAGLGFSQGIDSSIVPPYSVNPTISISRDLGGGFLLEASYVGRLGRRLLTNDTAASQYTNVVDPASGERLHDGLRTLENLARADWPSYAVARIPFFENLYSGAATWRQSATQRVYEVVRANSPDTGTAMYYLDYACTPFCSDLGRGLSMNPQFWAFDALRSFGTSTYHSMQLSLRKRFSRGFQFDLNYTLSRSEDLVSVSARRTQGGRWGQQPEHTYWSNFSVINSWDRESQRAVSDFNLTHQVNANWVAELPVGRGKRFLSKMGPAGEALLGGWQVSGLWRQTSGFPLSVLNGLAWPTCYCYQHFADVTGEIPSQTNSADARLIGGGTGPNVFSDPEQALQAFSQTFVGGIGVRNNIVGDGVFSIDLALGKRFRLPYEGHSIQFRTEAFNLTNSVRFNASWDTLSFARAGGFGNYSRLMAKPRVLQFGLRYEF